MIRIQDKHFDSDAGAWTISAVVELPDGTRCGSYQVAASEDASDEQLAAALMDRFAA